MDRTEEFVVAARTAQNEIQSDALSNPVHLPHSPFVERASQLLGKIQSFEGLLVAVADTFIDYHRFHPMKYQLQKSPTDMTDTQRVELTQEIALFVTSFAGEVRELRRSNTVTNLKGNKVGTSTSNLNGQISHNEDIVSYLLERLSAFTKMTQKLQNERSKYSVNPLSLFTNKTNSTLKSRFKDSQKIIQPLPSERKTNPDYGDLLNKLDDERIYGLNMEEEMNSHVKLPVIAPLTQSFVERYESEIAPPKIFKEYEMLGLKHKKILLKESKVLQVQYSEELLETTKMERTVLKISNLLFDFVNILQSQRELVDDVNKCGKVTIDFVKDTDDELKLTIQRSESHSQSMVFLSVGLALILLLIDFITP